nr:hypothetical protein [Tanacetum cinerariifolium]
MTHKVVNELIDRRVAEALETRDAARNLEPLMEGRGEQEDVNGGGNGNGGVNGNVNDNGNEGVNGNRNEGGNGNGNGNGNGGGNLLWELQHESRRELGVQREMRLIWRVRFYDRVRIGRLEACARKHLGYRP